MLQLDFIPFPELYTERLCLRQLSMKDENEVFLLRSDENVNKYLNRQPAQAIEDARHHIEKLNENFAREEGIIWAITEKGNDKLIGSVCFWKISRENLNAELGYELLPAWQGRGIMQEALLPVLNYGFEKMKLRSIEAELSPRNIKSMRLLEKNGFTLLVNNTNEDSLVYVLMNKA